jgi:lysophospholipase L1 and related esterases
MRRADMKKRRTASVIFGVILLCLFILLAFHMRQVKVVCVGDSITYGSGAGRYRDTKSYPALLQKKLGNGYRVRNYGLRGRTLLDYGNFPYKEEPEYKKTLKEKGDVYIIMLGTNDSKVRNWNTEDYKEQLRAFVTSYQKVNERAKIYLMQPPRCFPDEKTGIVNYKIKNDLIATEIHKSVAEVGLECGAIVIDLYEFTEDHGDWFADGVHPNVKGYEKIAGYIYEVLKETL